MTMRSIQRALPVGGEHAERHRDQHREQDGESASDERRLEPLAISSATVFLKKKDSPKSPCSRWPSQMKNCVTIGWSRPSCWRICGDLLGVGVVAGDDRRGIAPA